MPVPKMNATTAATAVTLAAVAATFVITNANIFPVIRRCGGSNLMWTTSHSGAYMYVSHSFIVIHKYTQLQTCM